MKTLITLTAILFSLLFTQAQGQTNRMYGITVDDVSNLNRVVEAISSLSQPMTVRIVFDEYVKASYYSSAIKKIAPIADIQGEILDSFYVKDYSPKQYLARTKEYLDAFGDEVDIWEIGNEVNGDWLLREYNQVQTNQLVHKLKIAYDEVKARGKKTALTLYYNGIYNNGIAHATDNCWSHPEEHMMTWAKRNLPQAMKEGLDYVWVSYYDRDCQNYKPNWQQVFNELGKVFPHAKIGIGECGTKNAKEQATGEERKVLTYYYQDMDINHPRFVGGYFWWYFNRDMVPRTKELWGFFNTLIKAKPTETPTTPTTPTAPPAPPAPPAPWLLLSPETCDQ